MSKVTKLGIAMVTAGMMEARTGFCLATAMLNTPVQMQMFLGIGCYIHNNRDTCVRQAMENNCTHLLFVDSDVMFKEDSINTLIKHAENGIDVVAGRYNKKILPVQSTVKEDIKELSEVEFVPTGFLLVNMEVYKKIGKPCFSFSKDAESEDYYFCMRAKEMGYKIYCDPTIEIAHLGTAIF